MRGLMVEIKHAVLNMWCINTMEYYSTIKKNKIMALAAAWVELEIIILSEVSQTKKRQMSYDTTYMWDLKSIIQMNIFIKQN